MERIIKNYDDLATTEKRKQLLEIIEAGIASVNPKTLLKNAVQYNKDFNSIKIHNHSYDLISGRIFVAGGGKAAGAMAEALEEIVGPDNITAGFVNCKKDDFDTKKIKVIKASHPYPDKDGVEGVEKMLEMKDKYDIGGNDLVLCLISGGGSALMTCPVEEVSLDDQKEMTKLLLESGAEIHEINAVRKHISKIKGGRLKEHFHPARVASVIISDVVGNDLDTIASGPTVPDSTYFRDAWEVLEKYRLLDRAPGNAVNYIKENIDEVIDVEEQEKKFKDNYIIGKNVIALEAMAYQATVLGLKPIIVTTELSGSPEAAAKEMAEKIINKDFSGHEALLLGGETTPALPAKHGQGGRNQHYALAAAELLGPYGRGWAMAAAATDGADFLPDIAGAVVDNETRAGLRDKDVDSRRHLARFDSYSAFKKIGNALIETGDTGTNVGDLIVYLI